MKLFLSVTILLLCCNCKSGKRQAETELPIGNLNVMKRVDTPFVTLDITNAAPYDYGDMVDEIRYIQLGDEEGVIGVPKKCCGYKGKFYIQEDRFDRIFIFDKSGKCLKKIEQKGRGAQEYLSISTIDINKDTDELVVVDGMSGRIFFYDLDGNFKRTQRVGGQTDLALWLKDSTYLHLMAAFQNRQSSELSGYGLLVTKGEQAKYKGYRYLPVQKGGCGNDDIFTGYNRICYRPLFSDSVYQILSDSTYGLAFHVKLENSAWEKFRDSPGFVDLSSRDESRVFPWIYETKDHIFGFCNYEMKEGFMTAFLYDKENNRTCLPYKEKYEGMNTLDQFWGYDVFGTYEDSFITLAGYSQFESSNLFERVKNGSLNVPDLNLEKIIKDMTTDSNPVLILTKFKRF